MLEECRSTTLEKRGCGPRGIDAGKRVHISWVHRSTDGRRPQRPLLLGESKLRLHVGKHLLCCKNTHLGRIHLHRCRHSRPGRAAWG